MNLSLPAFVIRIFVACAAFAHPFESLPCELTLGLGHRATGLGPRGLLKTATHLTPADVRALRKRGIFRWNERIFMVKNEDDAHRLNWINARLPSMPHADLPAPGWLGRPDAAAAATDAALYAAISGQPPRPDPLQRGLYVIDRGVKLEQLEGAARSEFFQTLPGRAIFELDDEGNMHRLNPALVAERLDPETMTLRKHFSLEPLHVVQPGWFAPRFRAQTTLAGLPHDTLPARAIEISRAGPDFTAQSFRADGDRRAVVATLKGTVINDVLYLDSAEYPSMGGDELRTLLIKCRNELLSGGIHLIETTKVWELHREPWTHKVPR